MNATTSVDGGLVIDKPVGPTSHDIVQQVRKQLGGKVGHTGTLDPLASGVLPLVLGRATRLARFFQGWDKEYLARIKLGISTDTLDREGAITDRKPVPKLTESRIQSILTEVTGKIQLQVPRFSAVKIGGRRLYELARQRQAVTPPSRETTVYLGQLLDWTADTWELRIHCSSGTYVRSLAARIGEMVGCGAHLQSLRRTRSGPFSLSQAIPPEQVDSNWQVGFCPLEELPLGFPRLNLGATLARRIRQGEVIPLEERARKGLQRIFCGQQLIAIAEAKAEKLRPRIVLASPSSSGGSAPH